MTTIKKTIGFNASDSTDLKKMTIEYFQKNGFKQKNNENSDTRILFERGSFVSNLWTFDPLKWKSTIEIEIIEEYVKAIFTINTFGQIPQKTDALVWETFIGNYQKYLVESNFDFIFENSKILNTCKRKNLKYIGWAAIGGLIGGLTTGFIAYWTGINSIVSIGAVAGAIALLTKKINEDKEKIS